MSKGVAIGEVEYRARQAAAGTATAPEFVFSYENTRLYEKMLLEFDEEADAEHQLPHFVALLKKRFEKESWAHIQTQGHQTARENASKEEIRERLDRKRKLDTQSAEIARLNSVNKTLGNEIDRVRKKLKPLQDTNAALVEQNHRLQVEINVLRRQARGVLSAFRSADVVFEGIRTQCEDMAHEK